MYTCLDLTGKASLPQQVISWDTEKYNFCYRAQLSYVYTAGSLFYHSSVSEIGKIT